jgi:hypothetical protein
VKTISHPKPPPHRIHQNKLKELYPNMNCNNGDTQENSELRLASPLRRSLRCFSPRNQGYHAVNSDYLNGLLSPKLEKELMKDRKVFFSPVKSMSHALRQSFTLGQLRKSPRKEEADDEHKEDKEDKENNDEDKPLTEEEVMILLCRELELISDDGEQE